MENFSEILGAIIVIAPIAIFLALMIIVRRALREQKIKLSELLIETDAPPGAEAANKKESEQTPVKRSASRFILCLSGITALVLAACITTYYIYMKIYCVTCADGLDLADFSNVLLALGIGVIPYSVNQVKKIRL